MCQLLHMLLDNLPALALFAFVSSITPGPNNLMLMASGANFGFRRSIPHMLGISGGFMVMLILAGLGLGRLFAQFPVSFTVLQILSIAYMLMLAWRIAHAAPVNKQARATAPMTFWQAAAFQWVNPKSWAMALTTITVYIAEAGGLMLLVAALIFALVNLPAVTLWTVLGQQMARVLTNPARLQMFNRTMAVLLIASLYPLLQMG